MSTNTKFIVQTSAACMPSSCWGRYRNVAVLEVEEHLDHVAMISERARGVVRVAWYQGKLNAGKTERCAYAKALKSAREYAAEQNAVNETTMAL